MSRRISGSSALNGSSKSSTCGIERERAGQPDALLHAAGELVRVLVLETGQPDELDHLLCARGALGLGDALDLEAERDVLDHAAVREQTEVLEDHRDRAAPQRPQLVGVGAGDVPPGDPAPSRRSARSGARACARASTCPSPRAP